MNLQRHSDSNTKIIQILLLGFGGLCFRPLSQTSDLGVNGKDITKVSDLKGFGQSNSLMVFF